MQTIQGEEAFTLMDFLKDREIGDNFVMKVVDKLAKHTPMLDDMTILECDDGTAMTVKVETEIPWPEWVGYNEGLRGGKTSSDSYQVKCAMMGTKLVIPRKLFRDAKKRGKLHADRLVDERLTKTMRGMRLAMEEMIIYGRLRDNPKGFNGLEKAYSKYGFDGRDGTVLCSDDMKSAFTVFNGGVFEGDNATADMGSIYLVSWGREGWTGCHPQGLDTGIDVDDMVESEMPDPKKPGTNVKTFERELYWQMGLACGDVNAGGRICNIPRNLMLLESNRTKRDKFVDLLSLMSESVKREGGKAAWYMDKTMRKNIKAIIESQIRGRAIEMKEYMGRSNVTTLFDLPIRESDAMQVKEAEVEPFAA